MSFGFSSIHYLDQICREMETSNPLAIAFLESGILVLAHFTYDLVKNINEILSAVLYLLWFLSLLIHLFYISFYDIQYWIIKRKYKRVRKEIGVLEKNHKDSAEKRNYSLNLNQKLKKLKLYAEKLVKNPRVKSDTKVRAEKVISAIIKMNDEWKESSE